MSRGRTQLWRCKGGGPTRGGGEDDGEADGQIEAAALRATAGLATLGSDTVVVHHFRAELLHKIRRVETADRTQRFAKELMGTSVMTLDDGGLPAPGNRKDGADRRATRAKDDILRR